MFVHRLGADMGLHRARDLVADLARQQEGFLATATRIEVTPATERPDSPEVRRLRLDHEPPAEYAALVGRAIHAARSALDELAVSLVVASGRAPRHTTFPIAVNAQHFTEELSHCLRHGDPRAREAVRSVTPWRGADDKLWELHQLDTAGRRLPLVQVGQLVPAGPARVPTALRVLQAAPPRQRCVYPLRNGSVLHADTGTVDSSLRLVIGEGELVRGQPVVESLSMLVEHAAVVVDEVVAAAARR